MKSLHVIRNPNEKLGLEVASRDSGEGAVSLLLIQDGVFTPLQSGKMTVYALADVLKARAVADRVIAVDDDGAIRLIADHDRVVVW